MKKLYLTLMFILLLAGCSTQCDVDSDYVAELEARIAALESEAVQDESKKFNWSDTVYIEVHYTISYNVYTITEFTLCLEACDTQKYETFPGKTKTEFDQWWADMLNEYRHAAEGLTQ